MKGLYRGATSSFLGMAFESSLMFGIYSQAKLFLRVNFAGTMIFHCIQSILIIFVSLCFIVKGSLPDDGPRPEIIVPSAMFGGAIISFVLCPTELVKVSYD